MAKNVGIETVAENKENYLSDIVGDMPGVSSVADRIQQEAENENKEENPNKPKVPQANEKKPGKRGRPPGSKTKAASNASRIGGIPEQLDPHIALENAQRLAAAQFIVQTMEVTGVILAGKTGEMEPSVEKPGITAAWDLYLKSKNLNDIPPGVMLCVMTGQYYARVLTAPEALPKTKKIRLFVKEKVFGIFLRFKNARSNRRDDEQRKNDVSQEAN